MKSSLNRDEAIQLGDDGELRTEKFCANCGTVNSASARGCAHCGAHFPRMQPTRWQRIISYIVNGEFFDLLDKLDQLIDRLVNTRFFVQLKRLLDLVVDTFINVQNSLSKVVHTEFLTSRDTSGISLVDVIFGGALVFCVISGFLLAFSFTRWQ